MFLCIIKAPKFNCGNKMNSYILIILYLTGAQYISKIIPHNRKFVLL